MALRGLFNSFYSEDKKLFRSIRNVFGFYPGNIYLYKLALLHRSASINEINGLRLNNERLEYLGDAIMSAVVADFLFKRFPYRNEGFLTEMRSKIVSRSSLNKLSKKLGLDKMILSEADPQFKPKSAGGDAFEALVGAIYLDKGYYFTKRVIVKRILRLHFDLEQLVESEISYKSRIIEWAQKEKHEIEFKLLEEVGEKLEKQFRVAVMVDSKQISESIDYSIKGAERIAAEKAWFALDLG